ncbi:MULTISPECIES: FeoA family protein [Tissierella]|uniref:Ferrous iron transport protein A n=1 Tax=Tissierella praeacuta DSM 18095 TaxID=1123404 RepID=A0A1M4TRX5_9FIRM|nr:MULTISPECIES: FeoA family protein [Tissierella]MBU5255932.1 ferrous iron transport protein A [Tissierella praeacuta]TCU77375.1 ferrous iron transport protein A [Tissierella praeacuta]SHE47240.1 ferrous iron transport protein A [Tissierella praeacuta DSM 18095]SUP04364.1 FeoA domain [Tissierella praeacuta]HAE92627.1 ferrous iron transport protein A [Tissierella sp.]
MLPLTFVNKGEITAIKKINGKDDTKRFLGTLGFVVGEDVTVISEFRGNLIVNIKGTRVALDNQMASRIMV